MDALFTCLVVLNVTVVGVHVLYFMRDYTPYWMHETFEWGKTKPFRSSNSWTKIFHVPNRRVFGIAGSPGAIINNLFKLSFDILIQCLSLFLMGLWSSCYNFFWRRKGRGGLSRNALTKRCVTATKEYEANEIASVCVYTAILAETPHFKRLGFPQEAKVPFKS